MLNEWIFPRSGFALDVLTYLICVRMCDVVGKRIQTQDTLFK